jgi:hypothetical protein
MNKLAICKIIINKTILKVVSKATSN